MVAHQPRDVRRDRAGEHGRLLAIELAGRRRPTSPAPAPRAASSPRPRAERRRPVARRCRACVRRQMRAQAALRARPASFGSGRCPGGSARVLLSENEIGASCAGSAAIRASFSGSAKSAGFEAPRGALRAPRAGHTRCSLPPRGGEQHAEISQDAGIHADRDHDRRRDHRIVSARRASPRCAATRATKTLAAPRSPWPNVLTKARSEALSSGRMTFVLFAPTHGIDAVTWQAGQYAALVVDQNDTKQIDTLARPARRGDPIFLPNGLNPDVIELRGARPDGDEDDRTPRRPTSHSRSCTPTRAAT